VILINWVIDRALLQAKHQTAYATSSHKCHELLSARVAATFLLKFYSQPGSDLDCWEPN